jgi:hypothetical protein
MKLLDEVDYDFERDEGNDRQFEAYRAAILDYIQQCVGRAADREDHNGESGGEGVTVAPTALRDQPDLWFLAERDASPAGRIVHAR